MPSAAVRIDSRAAALSAPPARLDIVVPVRDEQSTLEGSVRRLHAHLAQGALASWRIVIADNASTDATPAIAATLARRLDRVSVLRLAEPGRGRALRAAWLASHADVVAYMDVDLSTDLEALPALVGPLLAGHADIAVGSRLAPGAQVVRGARRELISRAYNLLLRTVLRTRFSDAQCGFKALRTDVGRALLPSVTDQAWFFDTELLVVAERAGLRIREVPVRWVDDPHSSVRILPTAWWDLCGVARLLLATRIARFMGVGVASTLAYVALYLLLREPLGAGGANALALGLTAVANTAANRRLTFGVRGRHRLVRQHLLGATVYAVTLGLTSGALGVLSALDPRPGRPLELAVLVAAGALASVTRFVALHTVVFARARRGPPLTAPMVARLDRRLND